MLDYGNYLERRRARHRKAWGWSIAVALACAALAVPLVNSYAGLDPVTIHVNGKESVNTSDGHQYRVYTDHGTFVMADSIVRPRFDTADAYGQLRVGSTYACKSFGWRVPLFSAFKNLTECHEVGS